MDQVLSNKAATGVQGLDDVLSGGFTRRHVFLLEGSPGTGKTTIALQFLREGAALDERCLYISLSETEGELRDSAQSHGMEIGERIEIFELVPPESLLDADQQQSLLYSSDLELGETTKLIFEAFERVKPQRVVIDSLSEIRLLAQSSLRYRRQILALKHFFSRSDATVLLLDDMTSDNLDKTVHSVVHGVIHLEQLAPDYGSERRRLRVIKYRGQSFRGGYHDFVIKTGGVAVFPRLRAIEHKTGFERTTITSGIQEFDNLLGGGIERGSSTLLIGPAGTGKSLFALQFVDAAVKRGEKAAVFIFDEELGLLFSRTKSMGLDLEKMRDDGSIHIEQLDAAELSPGEFAQRVRDRVASYEAKTVIIDSINGYQASMPEENALILHMHELLQYLNRQGANTFLTVAQHGLVGDMKSPVDVTYLADSVILLRYFEALGKVRRAVSVIKKRTGRHEETIREFRITDIGLTLGEPLTGFRVFFAEYRPSLARNSLCFRAQTRTATIPNRDAIGLIHAPIGRDAQIAASLLQEAGIKSKAADDLSSLVAVLDDNVAFVVVTEEALRSADLRGISTWIEHQPSWSDLPFIIMTNRGGGPERNPAAARLSEILGNVSFIERPFHATTFISVARSAMRGRRRQFEARLRIEALDEGERRLQTALEAGRLGAWELDLATGVLITSATCKAVFGRGPQDDFTYDDLLATIHPEEVERMQSAVRATTETGADYSIEYRTIWSDGSIHWAEIRAQLYRDRSGKAIKMVGVSADITARLKAEEHQRQINEILEERVAERTRELEQAHEAVMAEMSQRERAEEQLRQAQKMEAIGQLTGGVAHDFNNLLMAVLGNLELLRKYVGNDAKAIRLIDGAQQGAKRGASLTQRLLAFSRRQDLRIDPVDMRALVTGMEDLLRRSVGSTITVETAAPDSLPLVSADVNQVELALLNLAVNARDAMPNGGTIKIALREAEQVSETDRLAVGQYVVLSVADEGHGMDRETLQKAIEPFFSTKELGKGTGLGLSMIHGLALQLNGDLKLASKVGHGTTAELWIPVSTSVVLRIEPSEVALPTERMSGPKRILLVDDDMLIAMSSADMLIDLGHDVVEAHSGMEALELFGDGNGFDLLITDYSMPGMTGGDLAKAVRALAPTIPILIASGYAELPAGVALDVVRLGKPYTQEQLAAEISKLTPSGSSLKHAD